MAAGDVILVEGTPVVWADTTDFSSTNNGYTRTHQIDLTSVAAGEAREGAKADFSSVRFFQHVVRVGIEFDVAPTAGASVDFYWSSSASATAGTGNDGGAAGSDGDYKAAEELEWVLQLDYIGSLIVTADAATTVQYATISKEFLVPADYGMPVVYNGGDQALEGDAAEMFVALIPLYPQVQS